MFSTILPTIVMLAAGLIALIAPSISCVPLRRTVHLLVIIALLGSTIMSYYKVKSRVLFFQNLEKRLAAAETSAQIREKSIKKEALKGFLQGASKLEINDGDILGEDDYSLKIGPNRALNIKKIIEDYKTLDSTTQDY
ncbi:hypothetical protein OJ996_04970 [Luteolibacter sp. GHJ8]|uniref:Uncharacterized protein n=1 Tax=Luteolibacter rhizosphaerae TaxID=2989719 RepID=A0ABT3FZA7_9BACT|nr:hypothetical protein [Luteolibacter rhizosphaerae]MCW1912912.1 hypothetical protein [Luteolibacter rhizosphaerae]